MSHTPGPWFVTELGNSGNCVVYEVETGKTVCECHLDDAPLLQNAPDLLALVDEMSRSVNGKPTCRIEDWDKRARAVLARIKGEVGSE